MIKLVNDTIDKDDITALVTWLQQDEIPKLTKGELTISLEKAWASKIGTKYSVYVSSGSAAILLTLASLLRTKRLRNNKVVVSSLSWATDVSSPILLGMDTILCDCNLHDLSCDLNQLEDIFKKEAPASLILVSPLGLVPDMQTILTLCNKYDVILLEDVCESLGSKYAGQYLGSFGVAGFFSTYYGHHVSTIEGGFVTTNDEELYYSMLMMRSHGWDRDLPDFKKKELRDKHNIDDFSALYRFYLPGFNLRATDLQAFLGLRALSKIDSFALKRNKNYHFYRDNITSNLLSLAEEKDNFISNFAYPLVVENRTKMVAKLQANKIEIRPLIAGNVANSPMCLSECRYLNLSNSNRIDNNGFYIPNHQGLTEEDLSGLVQIINS